MARFYIGQRVRILYSENWPELAGQEGRIVPVPTGRNPFNGRKYVNPDGLPWAVAPDCWGHPSDPSGRLGWFAPVAGQIEPIQDPGHQVISWEEMADLWTPEKVGA